MEKIAEMISNDDFKASKKTISRRLKKLMNGEEYREYVHIVRSKALSGENHPMFGADRSGENNPFYGKKHAEESKRKMSESKKEKKLVVKITLCIEKVDSVKTIPCGVKIIAMNQK